MPRHILLLRFLHPGLAPEERRLIHVSYMILGHVRRHVQSRAGLGELGQTGTGPSKSASPQQSSPEAPSPVENRAVSAHFRPKVRATPSPDFGPPMRDVLIDILENAPGSPLTHPSLEEDHKEAWDTI